MFEQIYVEDFYQILKDFVRYYPPAAQRCERPQTFAVLEEFADLDTDNLMKTLKDKHKPFFYSRKWEADNFNKSNISYNYPILAIFNDNTTVKGLFKKVQETAPSIEIAYLDQYFRDAAMNESGDDNCKSRVRNEIYRDTLDMILNLGRYLKEVNYYVKDNKKFGLYHPSAIAALEETEATVDTKMTRQFQRSLENSQNDSTIVEKWDGGIRDLYGHFFTIKLPFKFCHTYTYDAVANAVEDRGDQG